MRFADIKLIVRLYAKHAGISMLDGVAAAINAFQRPNRFLPTTIYIFVLKPLGIGDIIMLSAFIQKVAGMFPTIKTFLATEYKPFIKFAETDWVHPKNISKKQLARSLVISPTLSWRHAKFGFFAKYHLGYFLSPRLMCNFDNTKFIYDGHLRHYIDRTIPLIKVLEKFAVRPSSPQRRPLPLIDKYDRLPISHNYICIAPYSNWPERQYPAWAYIELIKYYNEKYPMILLGGIQKAERDFIGQVINECARENVFNLAGRTSITNVSYILSHASLFIGNDSGLAHLAMFCQTPSVIIFGCVGGDLRVPESAADSESNIILGAGDDCRFFPCYRGFSQPVCRNKNKYCCLTGVTIESVIINVNRILMNGSDTVSTWIY